MKTSPELLTDILGVLGQISAKIDGNSAKASEDTAGKTKKDKSGLGFNLKDFAASEKTSKDVDRTSKSLKNLSTSLNSLLKQSSIDGIDSVTRAKSIAESISLISTSLPQLAKGVFRFGMMQKMGLVSATALGIKALMNALIFAANPAVAIGAAALASLGLALNGIANVLKSLGIVILAFAGGIVIMVGALWLASKAFGVGPLAAMGIVIGSMFILASGMALLGILGPAITRGAQAVGEMGKGLLWASGGLLAIFGTFTLINLISGGPKQTQEIMMSAIKAIGLMGLVFAGLGKVSPLITFGSIAVQQMGEGMLWVAGGLLALGGSYALLSLFGVDLNEMIYSVAKGIGMLGLVFAGIGLFHHSFF
jgi:hypothetical protein